MVGCWNAPALTPHCVNC